MAELHRKRRREGRSEEGNDGEGGKREEMRDGGETKWKNLRFPARGEDRAGRVRVGGGNLRQEAWSVRRSHPTVFHREATLIADVEATMDVGYDDRRGTHA